MCAFILKNIMQVMIILNLTTHVRVLFKSGIPDFNKVRDQLKDKI